MDDIVSRLSSRKLWLALLAAGVVFGNRYFNWNLKEDDVLKIVGSLLSFVLIEGTKDTVEAAKR